MQQTERTKFRRLPARGTHELATIHAILDAGFLAHVGFEVDGQPFVIPTLYGRIDDVLYVHGSPASRMIRKLNEGVRACLTVTIVDGLVLARSAFHHSMNYRSVMAFGTATLVDDEQEKTAALYRISNQVIAGRWDEVRAPSQKELKATSVLRITMEEASAKIRQGPPMDGAEDLDFPVWAGVLPLALTPGIPQPDAALDHSIAIPENVRAWGTIPRQ